jgi:hypothetical protein
MKGKAIPKNYIRESPKFEDDSIYYKLNDDPMFVDIFHSVVMVTYDKFEKFRTTFKYLLDVTLLDINEGGLERTPPGIKSLLFYPESNFNQFLYCISGILEYMQGPAINRELIERLDEEECFSNIFNYVVLAVELYWPEKKVINSKTKQVTVISDEMRELFKGQIESLFTFFTNYPLECESMTFGDFELLLVALYRNELMINRNWPGILTIFENFLRLDFVVYHGEDHKVFDIFDNFDLVSLLNIDDDNKYRIDKDLMIDKVEEELDKFSVSENTKYSNTLFLIFSCISSIQVEYEKYRFDISSIQNMLPLILKSINSLICYCCVLSNGEEEYLTFREFIDVILDNTLDFFFLVRKTDEKIIFPNLLTKETQIILTNLFQTLANVLSINEDLYFFIIPTIANHLILLENEDNDNRELIHFIGKVIQKAIPSDFPHFALEDDEEDDKDEYVYIIYLFYLIIIFIII